MYPRISDLFSDFLGIDLPFDIFSFGFMVALGALAAAWLLQKEFDRMYRTDLIDPVEIPDPETGKKKGRRRMVKVSPSMIVGTITVLAITAGFLGAKVFHILENLPDFFRAPGRMLFSSGGFTFYGGLIVAGYVIARYVRKKGIHLGRVADAMAPGLMIAYGIGRIGCHLSGDGDWGIAADVASKPDWLPMWLWAETYPNNILGIDLSAAPVYPTPIYEFVMAVVIFSVLWALRGHNHRAGWLFWLYLVLSGGERFLIEQIRVNNEFDILGATATQAEMIALLLIAAGAVGLWKTWSKPADGDERSGERADGNDRSRKEASSAP
ncbi:MAG: prolipoprotein diacylglyceryl transferase [Rhodothermales bacterium]|nr:prolipoprotein diacylglyceryl transferase [Rhodothermales bacterium]